MYGNSPQYQGGSSYFQILAILHKKFEIKKYWYCRWNYFTIFNYTLSLIYESYYNNRKAGSSFIVNVRTYQGWVAPLARNPRLMKTLVRLYHHLPLNQQQRSAILRPLHLPPRTITAIATQYFLIQQQKVKV